ncbi:cell wall hydrolase [Lachnospiraceae bacterium ZAX-1]
MEDGFKQGRKGVISEYRVARGETLVGQEAVVEAVLNRISSIEYPDSLYDVLSQKTKFTSWLQQESADPTKKEYLAILNVLEGKTNYTTMNAPYFSTKPRIPTYRRILATTTFVKFKNIPFPTLKNKNFAY